jgi:hypothetical protein
MNRVAAAYVGPSRWKQGGETGRAWRVTFQVWVHNSVKLLKVVVEAIEHCTKDQIKNHDDSNYSRKMIASAKARLTFRVRLCRTIQVVTAKPQGVDSGCVLNTSNKERSRWRDTGVRGAVHDFGRWHWGCCLYLSVV